MVAALTAPASASDTSPAAAGQATKRAAAPTATPSVTTAVAGAPVTVTGTASSGATVKLQRMHAQRWQTVATTAATGGSYTVTFPTDWYANQQVRVLETRTKQTSPVFKVRVTPDYVPGGSAGSWTHVSAAQKWRWNPCEPITYRINPAGGYGGQEADIHAAFAQVARATGFTFRYLGTTTKSKAGSSRKREDILLGWKSEEEYPRLKGNVMGVAMPWNSLPRYKGYSEIWRATIYLDESEVETVESMEWGYEGTWDQAAVDEFNAGNFKTIILHEVVHAIGLGHVDDRSQVMNPYTWAEWDDSGNVIQSPDMLQAGDLAGLASVGARNGCFPKPWFPSRG